MAPHLNFGDIGVKKGKDEGLTTELGEQVEVDGQLITFTETLYDGREIRIGYILEVNESDRGPYFMNNLELLIDGKSIGSYGMGGKNQRLKRECMQVPLVSVSMTKFQIHLSLVFGGVKGSRGLLSYQLKRKEIIKPSL